MQKDFSQQYKFLRIENFDIFAREVYMNFIEFLDPIENFSFYICGLGHYGSQPFICACSGAMYIVLASVHVSMS